MSNCISIEEALSFVGKVVRCNKEHREFVSKLVDIENNSILVFETKSGRIIRDPISAIILMQEVSHGCQHQ